MRFPKHSELLSFQNLSFPDRKYEIIYDQTNISDHLQIHNRKNNSSLKHLQSIQPQELTKALIMRKSTTSNLCGQIRNCSESR